MSSPMTPTRSSADCVRQSFPDDADAKEMAPKPAQGFHPAPPRSRSDSRRRSPMFKPAVILALAALGLCACSAEGDLDGNLDIGGS